ncbi:MAG: hypothetical protein PF517_15045 [Salinivirgaceae bacterium]|jgi:hypothetical protein|nr:hypothetical protein [Salinivirgaceae bacterium]
MIKWPNMLLVAGTGRNVGKTTFVCKVVANVSKDQPIIAIKITPHIHDLCSHCKILLQTERLIITEETSKEYSKDSSKMLAAGAQKVYYVQGADDQFSKVIDFLKPLIPNNEALVCESAALRNIVQPGYFVLMSVNKNEPLKKNAHLLEYAYHHIIDYDYQVDDLKFKNGKWLRNCQAIK